MKAQQQEAAMAHGGQPAGTWHPSRWQKLPRDQVLAASQRVPFRNRAVAGHHRP